MMNLRGSLLYLAAATILLSAPPASSAFYNRNVDLATQGELHIPSGPDADDIKVCLIDTGITPNPNLPQLTDGTITGESYVGDIATWKQDPNGLGTAVAGVILAHGRAEEEKIYGIVQDAHPGGIKLHVARALGIDRNTEGMVSEVFSALYACRDAGANIITMSFDIEDINNILGIHITKLYEEEGILFISASGNDGNSSSWFPASLPAVMSVGATASITDTVQTSAGVDTVEYEVRAPFSNYNPYVELSAVGDRVRTTWRNGGFAGLSMTEMAAGAVAGGAALLWSYDSTCSAEQIRGMLLKTAKQMAYKECDAEFGWGHLQLKDAVELLESHGGCSNGNDPNNLYLDSSGMFAGCPATEVPSLHPSVSASPTAKPTEEEPTFIPPTHSPSYTKKSRHHHHSHSKSHWHEWDVVPQCEDQLIAETCCDLDNCWWDSTLSMCTRFEIADNTCSMCLVGATPNPATGQDCCIIAERTCLWDSVANFCTRDAINDPWCDNLSDEPSKSPSFRPTPAPTPRPTRAPVTSRPTPVVTPRPTSPPTPCTGDKKYVVQVKGKQEKCERANKKGMCNKPDEISGGSILVRDICCSWC